MTNDGEGVNAEISFAPGNYFDWVGWRFAWCASPHWDVIRFDDGSTWGRVLLGLYLRNQAPVKGRESE